MPICVNLRLLRTPRTLPASVTVCFGLRDGRLFLVGPATVRRWGGQPANSFHLVCEISVSVDAQGEADDGRFPVPVQLTGWLMPSEANPGRSLDVTLFWRALGKIDAYYSIYVKLLDKEGEAIAICAGLHLAGMRGAALMENQGLFESGNVLKWAISLEVPMVILVGVMGYRLHIEQSLAGQQEGPETPELRLVGGAFGITKPFLEALGISHHIVQSDDDVKELGLAFDEALSTRRPVAVLLTSAKGSG